MNRRGGVWRAGVGMFTEFLCVRVNTPNPPFPVTHKHKIETPGGEDVYEPDDIPPVPVSPNVPPTLYREVLKAFAAECSIELGSDFGWTNPWEVTGR